MFSRTFEKLTIRTSNDVIAGNRKFTLMGRVAEGADQCQQLVLKHSRIACLRTGLIGPAAEKGRGRLNIKIDHRINIEINAILIRDYKNLQHFCSAGPKGRTGLWAVFD
jgi:hypothetical protein